MSFPVKNLVELLQMPVGLYFSPLKLYRNLGYLESLVIGWTNLWNDRSSSTFWEDQTVWNSVLEDIFCLFLQYEFSMTLGWLYDFLKPQFSSSGFAYVILKKYYVQWEAIPVFMVVESE